MERLGCVYLSSRSFHFPNDRPRIERLYKYTWNYRNSYTNIYQIWASLKLKSRHHIVIKRHFHPLTKLHIYIYTTKNRYCIFLSITIEIQLRNLPRGFPRATGGFWAVVPVVSPPCLGRWLRLQLLGGEGGIPWQIHGLGICTDPWKLRGSWGDSLTFLPPFKVTWAGWSLEFAQNDMVDFCGTCIRI